ncbi:hypothetical protein Tco_1392402 [Tanacetum coccineum]
MLQICLNLPGQKFEDPLFEEEILAFIRKLGYSRNMKSLSDVKVETLPQPWRTFGTIINKCLSGKVTRLDLLRLSRAQIMWGMYYQKNVDYVYLLWEDLVYQIENKEAKKNKDIFIPKHEIVQKYNAILPDTLTNQAMKESDAYKTYHDFATGKKSSDEDNDDEVSLSKEDDDNDDNKDNDGQDDDNEQTESDNDDLRVQTPSHFESTDDETYDKVTQGENVEGEELDEEEINKEEEVNELYRDVNVNLEGKDTEMTDALLANVQTTQVIEDTLVIITAVTPEVQ